MSSDEFKPFVYTPFLRRFTDERARDVQETRELYESVRARYFASPYKAQKAIQTFVLFIAERINTPLKTDFCVVMDGILQMEDSIFGFPEVNLDHLSMKEQVDLTRLLRAKDYFFAHEEKVIGTLKDALFLIFEHIAGLLPKTLAPSPFVIPLGYAIPNPKKLIDEIYSTLARDEYKNTGLFVNLFRQLYFNLCEVSGVQDPYDPKKPFFYASKNPAPLSEIIDGYLKHTPFRPFLQDPIPLQLTHEELFNHSHIVGGSGSGKTQLLQQLLLHLLTEENRPSLVIVDSQGDLINKLAHLDLPFDPILITPKDIKHPPALNIFDVKNRGYDETTREQVAAGVIQTFDYLFTGLLGADLTAKQGIFFKMVARLMLALPETLGRNATIMDMLSLMEDAHPYVPAIATLPLIPRRFFERDFQSKTYVQTKEQVRYRLMSIIENPTLERLFTSEETKLDIFTELNNGSVILVDTAKDFLKGSSAHFGKIFISLVLQAILERAAIPEHKRRHAFLFVDEAAEYFDQNINDLLTECRKYKLGCVFSHQYLDQATPQLRSSLAANTAIKMAGGVSVADARVLSHEMRTTSDFIIEQPRLHFACHIRNVTPQAVSIPIEVGKLEKYAKRTDYGAFVARNRQKVSSPISSHADHFASERPDEFPQDDTDDASQW